MILDNARTVPFALSARPPAVSSAKLSDIKVPTLVVGGEQSPASRLLINNVIAQSIPGSRVVEIPAVAHLIVIRTPRPSTRFYWNSWHRE
jgi:pimeloyl-ACP methyl ester carboxylesterase